MLIHTQTTLAHSVRCRGTSVHRGEKVDLSLRPAEPNTGVVFRCGPTDVPALFKSLSGANQATELSHGGARVGTVEHLLATLSAEGIDNVIVELDGHELPIFDGSAIDWVRLLKQGGRHASRIPRRYVQILKTVEVAWGDRSIRISPSDRMSLSCMIDFDHPLIGRQSFEIDRLTSASFEDELASARTFGFESDADQLRSVGLALGASLANTLVLTREGLLNEGGLRWPDEFVRHKALDLVGDLALLGGPVLGHIEVKRGGHGLHHALLSELMVDSESWRWTALPEPPSRSPEGKP
ncbi:MAG: UDP-3-O-[3-hydroxymyristoyl] N-acetylglucosamine deacetylase [Deltaproteobacteria bacterium]|nr:UDP-3-O-[3-hydroxymyristoyl] N-acetylglucosamine deacetylase [Deltaproteobacteria bacterium]